MGAGAKSFVATVPERCRVCYTCVRECPAKAIRIVDGQAEIIGVRCLNCGNCVRVCSQAAKQVASSIPEVRELLEGGGPVAAILAPSFPAEFAGLEPDRLVGMLRRLGFGSVHEVAFGADLVADRYRRLLETDTHNRWIATTCPAMISFVEKYHPDLTPNLAPIVSPMVAEARVLKRLYGDDLRIVFIGPCIAKKREAASSLLKGDVDAAITYTELRQLFDTAGIRAETVEPVAFDPPYAGSGSLFPLNRGMLQAAGIIEDLMSGTVVSADGRTHFMAAVKEFEDGDLDARLLEVLCCNGCIMGPGMSTPEPLYSRRARVSRYVRETQTIRDRAVWEAQAADFANLDLSRSFKADDQRIPVRDGDAIACILERMGKYRPEDELNCGACGYETCREHALAIYKGLAESEMCLPYTIDRLRATVTELADSNSELASTREALVHSEKMASMGQLAAGIAHEVNNPLGVVLMYSHMLLDEHGDDPRFSDDLRMIVEQTDRCKKIVAGLLGFARQNKVVREPVDIRSIVERSLATLPAPENIRVEVRHDGANPAAELDRDQVIQVVTNLIANAYGAMPNGGTLTVRTGGDAAHVRLSVSDTGTGIPREIIDKIFEPFFSTKKIGKGTGLGLAVTYGIVKMHYGSIDVKSNADPSAGPTGTTFTVTFPRHGRDD